MNRTIQGGGVKHFTCFIAGTLIGIYCGVALALIAKVIF